MRRNARSVSNPGGAAPGVFLVHLPTWAPERGGWNALAGNEGSFTIRRRAALPHTPLRTVCGRPVPHAHGARPLSGHPANRVFLHHPPLRRCDRMTRVAGQALIAGASSRIHAVLTRNSGQSDTMFEGSVRKAQRSTHTGVLPRASGMVQMPDWAGEGTAFAYPTPAGYVEVIGPGIDRGRAEFIPPYAYCKVFLARVTHPADHLSLEAVDPRGDCGMLFLRFLPPYGRSTSSRRSESTRDAPSSPMVTP